MRKSTRRDSFPALAEAVAKRLRGLGVHLTIGGEPSYVPVDPSGQEWSITALGPDKLRKSEALAQALLEDATPGALRILSPGKYYPGEPNPRWAIHLVANRDGTPLAPPAPGRKVNGASIAGYQRSISKKLKVKGAWQNLFEVEAEKPKAWALPLDHDGARWFTGTWRLAEGARWNLMNTDGPAGLRLPLQFLPPDALRRALVVELKENGVHVFIPPLLQAPFLDLLAVLLTAAEESGMGMPSFEGYVPDDEAKRWSKLSVTPDPGVIEINLPPCESVEKYAWWLEKLETCGAKVGLRSYKQFSPDETFGTGGGNHLLFGGPSLAENPFFFHPHWVTSILRFWQHHPSLSYLFTGVYVGASSQAPRPDECTRELYDLEMAYQFLESLPEGQDHRALISETLRHLHIDRSGNTHRSEISFDKFWNAAWDGGCRGLIEFRAIESLPHAEWMSAIGLLWVALAASLLEEKYDRPLVDHGAALNDRFFLPSSLWEDFRQVLQHLAEAGLKLDDEIFLKIWNYRFPTVLDFGEGALVVRRGLEGWPLLCETPLEGGNTSRFVDTSIERLEFAAGKEFTGHRVYVHGRELKLIKLPGTEAGAGLRYRRTALYPSLHPGIAPHIPLFVSITDRKRRPVATYRLDSNRRIFEPCPAERAPSLDQPPCRKLHRDLLTYDLRLP